MLKDPGLKDQKIGVRFSYRSLQKIGVRFSYRSLHFRSRAHGALFMPESKTETRQYAVSEPDPVLYPVLW